MRGARSVWRAGRASRRRPPRAGSRSAVASPSGLAREAPRARSGSGTAGTASFAVSRGRDRARRCLGLLVRSRSLAMAPPPPRSSGYRTHHALELAVNACGVESCPHEPLAGVLAVASYLHVPGDDSNPQTRVGELNLFRLRSRDAAIAGAPSSPRARAGVDPFADARHLRAPVGPRAVVRRRRRRVPRPGGRGRVPHPVPRRSETRAKREREKAPAVAGVLIIRSASRSSRRCAAAAAASACARAWTGTPPADPGAPTRTPSPSSARTAVSA